MQSNNLYTELREKIAQAWCSPENSHKEMDIVLAEAIAKNIKNWIKTDYPSFYRYFEEE
jgi:hypothetical protein